MTKFLHTSDWQMGLKAVHAGVKSKELRMKRFEAASRIADIAKERNVDFVILAGDTFEHHDVDEVIVKKTVEVLNRFAPISVYILPGNHDPWVPGGIWGRRSWERVGSHVTLCTAMKEIQIGYEVVLYPCPLMQKKSGLDPTSWIPNRAEGEKRIRIGIAHGSLDIIPNPDMANFPISKNRPEQSGLDYLALGDWHSFFQHGRAVYSGTPEPTNFNEPDSGDVVILEIREAGENPRLNRYQTRSLTWAEFSPTIQDLTDVEALENAIKQLGPVSSLALRINPKLEAVIDDVTIQALSTLGKELEQETFFLDWNIDSPAPASQKLAAHMPEGILQRIDEALSAILTGEIPEGPGRAYAGTDPVVVQTAQALLHRLALGGNE